MPTSQVRAPPRWQYPVDAQVSIEENVMTVRASRSNLTARYATSTSRPTKTSPGSAPRCAPTPQRVPTGRMQLCTEADGAGVTGYFTFEFADCPGSLPVGACADVARVDAGTLTITEEAQDEDTLCEIYTLPADRWIRKDLSDGKATVRIVYRTTSS